MGEKEVDPRMHTAEHILNRTMVELFGSDRCFNAHIEKKKSKCDYYFDKELTNDELQQIEDKENEIRSIIEFWKNLPNTVHRYEITVV